MVKDKRFSVCADDEMDRQVRTLAEKWNSTLTDTFSRAIDRAYLFEDTIASEQVQYLARRWGVLPAAVFERCIAWVYGSMAEVEQLETDPAMREIGTGED